MRAFFKSYTAGALAFSLAACGVTAIRAQTPAPGQAVGQDQHEPATGGAIVDSPRAVTANKAIAPGEMMARGNDQQIATMLAIANEEEIAMARLAQSKIQNRDVRNFAEMMLRDHSQFLDKLAQFGGRPGFGSQQDANSRENNSTTQPGQSPAIAAQQPTQVGQAQLQAGQAGQPALAAASPAMNRGQLDFVSIKRQIAQMCIASATKDLDAKKPYEAEMDYVGSQVVAHKQMLDTLKVVRQYASAEFQPTIDKGIETTEMHLQDAKKLIKTLASAESHGPDSNR